MLSCYFVLFLISAGGAFQISAPRSVTSEATVVWNRNDGDPDDSVFARRLLPAQVGDQLPESPGSLSSGTINVEFPVPGTYLIEIRTPQPEFRLLAESDTIFAATDPSDSSTSGSVIATSSSISSTLPIPIPSSSTVKPVQLPGSSTTVSGSGLQSTSTIAAITVDIVLTVTDSSSSLFTPSSTVTQESVNANTSDQITSGSINTPSTTKVIPSTSATNIPPIISSDPDLGTTSIPESTSVSTTLSGKLVTDTPSTSTNISTPTAPTSPTSSVSSRNHIPQIVGGTLGSFLFIILLVAFFIFYRRRCLRRPSFHFRDIEKRKEPETPSRPDSMDQPLTRPESYPSVLTSPVSPISQRTLYLSYMDGFLRRLDSDPHRHERDLSIASSGISHLTSRQFLLHERAGSLRDEADWLKQTISSTPPDDRIVEELQMSIRRLEEQVQRLEAEQESDWALHQSDEPPPVYMEVISRTQSNS
ncbi:hypothetical protein IW261DRAFT_1647085 [Armillaria novae-zelandiae]|uniref:Mid2 domain-containing protein n=1 Tax=Armillaria novae-zelandiae TaxID=153914 RepID=A0AA39U0Q9_9AGAR|nr:hypothetical protein IW261DRAFT_1647085 [Armillaria novae-zelandiae]